MADVKKTMIATEVDLDLRARAQYEAARRGVSLSALIRDALDRVVPKDIRIVVGADPSTRRSMKS